MNSTKLKVEEIFADIISRDSLATEQKTKSNTFIAEITLLRAKNSILIFLNLEKKENNDIETSVPPSEYIF